MKKKYISPATTLIKVHTENVLASLSKTETNGINGKQSDGGPNSDIDVWNGNYYETAKGNDGFIFWEDEN